MVNPEDKLAANDKELPFDKAEEFIALATAAAGAPLEEKIAKLVSKLSLYII